MVVQEKHLMVRMGNSATKDVIQDGRRQDNANNHIAQREKSTDVTSMSDQDRVVQTYT